MADKIQSVLRLLRLYARMDLNWVLQDFKAALIVVCAEIINNLTAVSGILLLAVRFGGAGGLNTDEILLMLGFFELADALASNREHIADLFEGFFGAREAKATRNDFFFAILFDDFEATGDCIF